MVSNVCTNMYFLSKFFDGYTPIRLPSVYEFHNILFKFSFDFEYAPSCDPALSGRMIEGPHARKVMLSAGHATPGTLEEASREGKQVGRAEPQSHAGDQLSARLFAAKPLMWWGQSELPQLPWAKPAHGLILVIDMWAGLSGLLVALLALGVRCVAIAAEQDHDLVATAQRHFPNLAAVDTVEEFAAAVSSLSLGEGPSRLS